MTSLPMAFARRVADRVNQDWGEKVCTPEEVALVAEGSVSLVEREAVESRILQELEEHGVL